MSPVQEGLSTARRGRPTSESLPELIRDGEINEGPYKCEYCSRKFPRNKSLMAHKRTHTGERPYVCTYPDCTKSFKQSGQLKTHEKRHTGEKPFACVIPDCTQRFIHSSRRCSKHPWIKLQKDGNESVQYSENLTLEEIFWLNEYEQNKGRPLKRRRISSTEYENVPIHNSSMTGSETGTEYESSSSEVSDIVCSGDESIEETHQIRFFPEEPLHNLNGRRDMEAAFALLSFSNQTCYRQNECRRLPAMPFSAYV